MAGLPFSSSHSNSNGNWKWRDAECTHKVLTTVWHDLQNCIHESPPKWQLTHNLSLKIENKSEIVIGYIHYLWIYAESTHIKLNIDSTGNFFPVVYHKFYQNCQIRNWWYNLEHKLVQGLFTSWRLYFFQQVLFLSFRSSLQKELKIKRFIGDVKPGLHVTYFTPFSSSF